MRIKDISKENRPRERLQKYGASSLSDAELLAIILRTGTKKENVIDMSNRLLFEYGIHNLCNLSLKELQKIHGIGHAKAMQINASFEFNKRYNMSKKCNQIINSSKDVFEYISPKLSNLDKEHFIVIHLNSKNRIIADETVSVGILNASIIHPREIFKSAIKNSVNSIILVHNHPSGDPAPSEEDEEITKKLTKAGELLNIKVLDHVIVGDGKHYSFKEEQFL